MSLIAPSNLLALQSYSAPSKAPVRAGNEVFKALDSDTTARATGRQSEQGDQGGDEVTVQLSRDAVRHIESGTFAIANASPADGTRATPASPTTLQATSTPQDNRPLAPGSRLDITI